VETETFYDESLGISNRCRNFRSRIPELDAFVFNQSKSLVVSLSFACCRLQLTSFRSANTSSDDAVDEGCAKPCCCKRYPGAVTGSVVLCLIGQSGPVSVDADLLSCVHFPWFECKRSVSALHALRHFVLVPGALLHFLDPAPLLTSPNRFISIVLMFPTNFYTSRLVIIDVLVLINFCCLLLYCSDILSSVCWSVVCITTCEMCLICFCRLSAVQHCSVCTFDMKVFN